MEEEISELSLTATQADALFMILELFRIWGEALLPDIKDPEKIEVHKFLLTTSLSISEEVKELCAYFHDSEESPIIKPKPRNDEPTIP